MRSWSGLRREGLPRRVKFAEIGSVRLPAVLFDELRASQGRGWTGSDVGRSPGLLNAFELRDASVVQSGRFEEAEGEPVLVGNVRELRFSTRVNAPPDAVDASRVYLDTDYLSRTGWFEHTAIGGRIELRLGPRAKALREGRR